MTTITDAQIKRLRELMTKTTPPPWDVHGNRAFQTSWLIQGPRLGNGGRNTLGQFANHQEHERDICAEGNAALIAEMRNCLPALLDALESRATPAPVAVDEVNGETVVMETTLLGFDLGTPGEIGLMFAKPETPPRVTLGSRVRLVTLGQGAKAGGVGK